MRWLLILFAAAAPAQDFGYSPRTVRQGETLKLRAGNGTARARMSDVTVPLFAEANGSSFGLMPVKVDQKPGEYRLEFLDGAESVVHAVAVTVLDAHYPKQNIVLSAALSGLRASPDEGEAVRAFLKEASATRYWQEPLRLPVAGCMTSPYGVARLHNGKPTGDHHGGIDQRAGQGAPIRAVAAGTVRVARQFTLRGGTVGIDHGQGLESMYLHMSKVTAVEGQTLGAGDVIGYAGSTGRSTAPHLHWSLYANGIAVNPSQWVKPRPCGAPARRK
jgi:murein DD-endopeptidase MepM/ murein hydrolase activator NlpD